MAFQAEVEQNGQHGADTRVLLQQSSAKEYNQLELIESESIICNVDDQDPIQLLKTLLEVKQKENRKNEKKVTFRQ